MSDAAASGAEGFAHRWTVLTQRLVPIRFLSRAARRALARPADALLSAVAVGVCAWVLIAPFAVVKYPPVTDLPMHAAVTSALRHWFDKSWHFRDQFELQLFQVPTLAQYGLGAILALFLPIAWAVKLATSLLLSLLPIGLAVYCMGLRKNPLFGVAAAGLAHGPLSQWGFVSYMGSLGLTMMGLGVTLLVLESPTRARILALGAISVFVFFTHVSRFPIYCAAIAITTLCMLPSSRRVLPVLIGLGPSVAIFVAWWLVRPRSLSAPIEQGWHFERISEIRGYLFQSFGTAEENVLLDRMGLIALGVGAYSLVANALVAWRKGVRRIAVGLHAACAFVASLTVVLLFAGLFFWLPMSIGDWWYVYPREITAACLCSLALVPRLPRNPWLAAPAVAALLYGIVMPMRFISARYAQFDRVTADFQKIIELIPRAPKLGYIVWDHSGFDSVAKPFLHLPAWVQAEKGGWLSFHFATWNANPLRYRTTEPKDVAPDTPTRFEWNPQWFDLLTRGKYFNWFLVRASFSPDAQFAVDPSLHRVDHQGTWWLYKRE